MTPFYPSPSTEIEKGDNNSPLKSYHSFENSSSLDTESDGADALGDIFQQKETTDEEADMKNGSELQKSPTPPLVSNQCIDYLEYASSPKSVESQASSRSHDGVFLRPDAVATMNSSHGSPISQATTPSSASPVPTMMSLLSGRLVKRTSIDSGINMDSSVRSRTGKGQNRSENQLLKLNRFDRSMSLPVSNSIFLNFNSSNSITTAASLATAAAAESAAGIDSAIDSFSLSIDSALDPNSFYSTGSNVSLNNTSLLSPPRRMDFALCKFLFC